MSKKEKPFDRPPLSEKGDKDPDAIFLSVGRCLSTWERTEESYAHLYGTFIKPMYASYAAKRSYGALASGRGRQDLLVKSSEVFFRNFPSPETKAAVSDAVKLYASAGSRRNEIAHGMLGSNQVDAGIFYFLVPSMWNSNKRGMNLEIEFRYSSKDIDHFEGLFGGLRSQVLELCEKVIDVFQAAPEKHRRKW